MLETNPLIILASAGIFALFKGRKGALRDNGKTTRLTKAVVWSGAQTFGIYLIHFAVRDCLAHYLGFDVASYSPALTVPLNSLLIFAKSLALTVLVKRIPGLRRVVA